MDHNHLAAICLNSLSHSIFSNREPTTKKIAPVEGPHRACSRDINISLSRFALQRWCWCRETLRFLFLLKSLKFRSGVRLQYRSSATPFSPCNALWFSVTVQFYGQGRGEKRNSTTNPDTIACWCRCRTGRVSSLSCSLSERHGYRSLPTSSS